MPQFWHDFPPPLSSNFISQRQWILVQHLGAKDKEGADLAAPSFHPAPLTPAALALCCLLSGGSLFWRRFHGGFSGLRGCRSESIYACLSRKNSAHGLEGISARSPRFRTVPNP